MPTAQPKSAPITCSAACSPKASPPQSWNASASAPIRSAPPHTSCSAHPPPHTPANDTGSSPPEVGTEHLLAVLALDPGSRARRVLNDLHVDIAAVKGELQRHITVNPTRPTRWWKRRPPAPHCCTFCGQAAGPEQLVNGPDVTICRACVALAADILTARQT
ncbi:hypothetical protein GCM10009558_009990 [Virgisporangium aurantiacum]